MRTCPACGHANPATAEHCSSCGTALLEVRTTQSEARKTVTVLFCDVEGSTSLGDRLDPESLRQVMMRFFLQMRGVLERHGGTVEKYIGDAVMAVFGVPRLNEDDALRAVRAAAEMQSTLLSLNEELDARFGVRLRIRIGINTGEVVVGNAASGQALVLGDPVNVAARLEQAAPVGETLIGVATHALVRDHVELETVGPLELKGKPGLVQAYRLVRASPPSAAAARPDPPLVGRTLELAALADGFARCTGGREAILLTVMGSAGIGKSRLSREFVATLGSEAMLLSGRCLPYGDGITFWPVIELVQEACGIVADDPRDEARAKLDAAVRGADDADLIAERLAELLGVGGETTGLQETFWAIRRFLEWLGRERPVVVILDDLQWGEPTLLDLVEYLAGWTRDTALFLLCLARPDLLDVRPSWAQATASTLSLGPLDEDESRRLIGSLLGGESIDSEMGRRISESAGGNALFLEEMIRMLEDDGLLRREQGPLVVAGDLSTVTVPASIHALLGSRLDRLSEHERTVIRCASVVGRTFWWGAISELVPEPMRQHVGSHLQTLVRKDLIQPDRSSFAGQDAFRFHHMLVQEAAYRSTPKELRAELHARFADWMVRTTGERETEFEEVIGYHLEQAFRYRSELAAADGDVRTLGARAARYLSSAGRRALERRDVSAAGDLLGRSASLFASDDRERVPVLLGLGEALLEAGNFEGVETSLAEVERMAGGAADEQARANAAVLRLFLLQSTDPKRLTEDGEAGTHSLIRRLEELGDEGGLARAWRLVADLHWARSHYAAADEALVRAISHARRAADVREEAECLGRYVGSGAYGPAHADEIERRATELLSSAAGMGGRDAPALRALAMVRAMQGRFDEARELAGRARRTLEEFGFRLRASWVSETIGAVERLAGDLPAAERAFREGFEAATSVGEQGFRSTVAALLAHALVGQGRLEEAEEFAIISETSAADDDVASQVLWRSARGRILAESDSPAEGEPFLRAALDLVEETDDVNMHADTLVDLGIVEAASGRTEQATEALERAIALYSDKGNVAAAEAAGRRRDALAIT